MGHFWCLSCAHAVSQRLSGRLLHTLASVLFLMFGLWMLFDGAFGWRAVAIAVISAVALLAATLAAQRQRRRRTEVPVAGRPSDTC